MKTQNTQAIKQLRDAIGDKAILNNADFYPIIDISPLSNRDCDLNASGVKTSSGNYTIVTLDPNKKNMIKGIIFSYVKDAACDIANGTITLQGVKGGASFFLANLSVLTLTAQTGFISLPINVSLDKGSSIQFGNQTYAAGSMVRSAVIIGYYVDE